MIVLITGAAGYVGKLLIKKLIQLSSIKRMICLDLIPKPPWVNSFEPNDKRIIWIKTNLAENNWEKEVIKKDCPQIVIHSAFQIRTPYGRIKEQERNNLNSSIKVFNFCFENGIEKLIYLSSVAAYGAKRENIGKLLKEDDPLKEEAYPYGYQKRIVEEKLTEIFKKRNPKTKVFILRPATITGPSFHEKKGLSLISLIKFLPILPVFNPYWARQFVHEEDVINAIIFLMFNDIKSQFEIFNLAPPQILTMKKIAKILHKKTIPIPIPLFFLKIVFFLSWHLFRGKLPTPPGSANYLMYPINVDGSKITHFGFSYQYSSQEALEGKTKFE
jgi:nucleoside-diphosphate-sugar epimerase